MLKPNGIKKVVFEFEDRFGHDAIREAFRIIEDYKEKSTDVTQALALSMSHVIRFEKFYKEAYFKDPDWLLKLALALEIYLLTKNYPKVYEELKNLYFLG